ncbi:MAG: hypothetical protein ACRDUA_23030, partial [Micromonosporaceae bacterium]
MTITTQSVARRDPGTLLRRIGRHVPFDRDRVVVALVRLSRTYVDRAGWIDTPSLTSEVRVDAARSALRAMLTTIA